MTPWPLMLNILLFQVAWLCAAFDFQALSVIAVISLLVLLKQSQLQFISVILGFCSAFGLGVLMDIVMHQFGIYHFPNEHAPILINTPTWLLLMWAAFSTTLFTSFYWALARPLVFMLLCGLLGPVSYLAGREIGIIQFDQVYIAIMVCAWLLWAALFLTVWHGLIKRYRFIERRPCSEL